ncbi:hypothetical protein HBB16_18200 [Pseudonocardia sp. MCCB 268]|nr:hypothetical protein [Pseudonocardia cytotoxica]
MSIRTSPVRHDPGSWRPRSSVAGRDAVRRRSQSRRPSATRPPPSDAGAGRRTRHALCGALQYSRSSLLAPDARDVPRAGWVLAGSGLLGCTCGRSFSGATLLVLCVLPIIAGWVLIRRWQPAQIRSLGMAYLRFWIVRTLVRSTRWRAVRRNPTLPALPAGTGRAGRPGRHR